MFSPYIEKLSNLSGFLVARGLPRDTENNPDHWEIFACSVSSLCQHFPNVFKKILLLFITSQ